MTGVLIVFDQYICHNRRTGVLIKIKSRTLESISKHAILLECMTSAISFTATVKKSSGTVLATRERHEDSFVAGKKLNYF